MKPIPFLFLFLVPALLTSAETTVSATQDHQLLEIGDDTMQQIEKLVSALLISTDYEAPKKIATEARWQQALKASHIHVIFSKPRIFSFRFSTAGPATLQDVSTGQIVIPISRDSAPDYIFVRFHDQVRAFSKYHDREALVALQKILPPHSNP